LRRLARRRCPPRGRARADRPRRHRRAPRSLRASRQLAAMTDLAERFDAERPRLVRLAYGQLGSFAEAEDVVQDAWLRLQRVAAVLGTTVQSARQHASRARRAVEARRPRFPATREQQREVVAAFAAATLGGDIGALVELLDPDVVLTADGGGVVLAAPKPIA